LPVLEAMAAGAAVVLPRRGIFSEQIDDTGGGLLYDGDDPAALTAALRKLVTDRNLARSLGRAGKQAVFDRYHAQAMAEATVAFYRRLLGR